MGDPLTKALYQSIEKRFLVCCYTAMINFMKRTSQSLRALQEDEKQRHDLPGVGPVQPAF